MGRILEELNESIKEETLEDLLGGAIESGEDEKGLGGESDEESEEELTDLMKHHKALQKMIDFVDELTDDGENNELAFDVEEALRSAMEKMVKLNDEVYKNQKDGEKPEQEEKESPEEEKRTEF